MTKKNFILSFDIPRGMNTLRTRVFRALKRNNVKLIHESLWLSDNLNALMEIALLIKRSGGTVRILEEKFVF